MVVAVPVVRVVQMAANDIVRVIAMGDGVVAARGPVDMRRVVGRAGMTVLAAGGILRGNVERVLVDVVAVNMMQVPIVKEVDVVAVRDLLVTAVRTVNVGMVFVCFVIAHDSSLSSSSSSWSA